MTYKNILNSIDSVLKPYTENISLDKLNLTKDYNIIKEYNYKKSIDESKSKIEVKPILIEKEINIQKHYSKSTYTKLTEQEISNMEFGTYIHNLLEIIDFNNPRLEELEVEPFYKNKIQQFLNLDILKGNNLKFYKEFEFIYKNNNEENHGIIDLIIESENDIKIVDYKLKNIKDDKYLEQLNGYKTFVETKTYKPVSIYLYSILDNKLEKLDMKDKVLV